MTSSVQNQDTAFEFNAPRWYDFQRLNESLPSPTSDVEAYFTSSKVKELRTPTRDAGEDENEDLGKMQEDLERVRQEMRDEATSARRPTHTTDEVPPPGVAEEPEAELADEGHHPQDVATSHPDTREAEAMPADPEPTQASPAAEAANAILRRLQSAAAEAPVAQPPPQQQPQKKPPSAQPKPQPWPMLPRAASAHAPAQQGTGDAAAAEGAVATDEAAPQKGDCAQVRPRQAPSNLVTSWGPSVPARRIMAHQSTGPLPLPSLPSGGKEAASGSAPVASFLAKAPATAGSTTAAADHLPAQQQTGPKPSLQKATPRKQAVAGAKESARGESHAQSQPLPKQQQEEKQRKRPTLQVDARTNAQQDSHAQSQQKQQQPRKKGTAQADAHSKEIMKKALTKPRSPKLGVLTRGRHLVAGLCGSSLARQLDQARHPQRSGGRVAAPASTAPRPAAAAEAAGGKRPTRPLSPDLRTAKRHRANSAQPPLQEPQAEEWKPLALAVAEFEAATPARFRAHAGPRAMQYVPPPQRDPREKPKAPQLAVESRVRPSHVKPREERELEEIASVPAFKARPVDRAVMSSQGQLGVPHIAPKPPTTSHAPVLVTEKRAAAQPKPEAEALMPRPAPKPFDPLHLTVPRSPKFATTNRTRSKSMAIATGEPPAFVFTAKRAAGHGDGSTAAAAKAARRRRHTTNFQPFHLSTEERGGAKRAAQDSADGEHRAESEGGPPFRATPVPPTLHRPAPLPPVAEKPPTAPRPFSLASDARHREAVALRETQDEFREAERRRGAAFKAAPAPPRPPLRAPRPSGQPLTNAHAPDLALRSRSLARATFDAAAAGRRRAAEDAKAAEAERAARQEAHEVKRYRQTLTFKAKPAPGFGVPLFDLSEPGLLQSPFQNTRSRSKLPR